MSKNPLFRNGEENEKLIRNPHTDPDHHQKSITSRGSLLPMPAKFGWRPFPCLSVMLFTEWRTENDHITSALIESVVMNFYCQHCSWIWGIGSLQVDSVRVELVIGRGWVLRRWGSGGESAFYIVSQKSSTSNLWRYALSFLNNFQNSFTAGKRGKCPTKSI